MSEGVAARESPRTLAPVASLAVAADTPRADALESRARDAGEWNEFMMDVLEWCCAPTRVNAARKHTSTLGRAALEKWLRALGTRAEPLMLGGTPNSCTASDLLTLCSALDNSGLPSHGASAATVGTVELGAAQPFVIAPPDLTGGETALGERAIVREDARELACSPQAVKELTDLAELASSNSEEMARQVNTPDPTTPNTVTHSPAFRRLVLSGDDVRKAISGQVPEAVERTICAVRHALDRRLERAVLRENTDLVEQWTLSAIRWVRLGRISKCRLLHLIGKEADTSTDADPLAGFAAHGKGAVTLFALAMQRLAQTWGVAYPPHAGLVSSFCTELGDAVARWVDQGTSWSDLSRYYRMLMRKVDTGARRFAAREDLLTPRTAPNPSWVEGDSDFMRELQRQTTSVRLMALEAKLEAKIDLQRTGAGSGVTTGKSTKSLKRERYKEKVRARKAGTGTGSQSSASPKAASKAAVAPDDADSDKQRANLPTMLGTHTKAYASP